MPNEKKPNEKHQCEHYGKFCATLEKYESYRKFISYKNKVLALGNDSLEKTIAILMVQTQQQLEQLQT